MRLRKYAGKALRRVMLSSLTGAAAAYIRIEDAPHEFSTLPGVKEDVCEIVLNVKSIVVKLHSDSIVSVSIRAVGPCTVTAGDIRCGSGLEVVNPGQSIATLDDGATLNMELAFTRGRGYTPAEKNKTQYAADAIGVIPVDSISTPVIGVNYSVENTRVGDTTDFGKLTMQIKTNGSVTPDEAVSSAYLTDAFLFSKADRYDVKQIIF